MLVHETTAYVDSRRLTIKKHRFIVALQNHIPLKPSQRDLSREQRTLALSRHSAEHVVVCVPRLIGKVNSRDKPLEQPPHEDGNQKMRRLLTAFRVSDGARLNGLKPEVSIRGCRYAAKSVKVWTSILSLRIALP